MRETRFCLLAVALAYLFLSLNATPVKKEESTVPEEEIASAVEQVTSDLDSEDGDKEKKGTPKRGRPGSRKESGEDEDDFDRPPSPRPRPPTPCRGCGRYRDDLDDSDDREMRPRKDRGPRGGEDGFDDDREFGPRGEPWNDPWDGPRSRPRDGPPRGPRDGTLGRRFWGPHREHRRRVYDGISDLLRSGLDLGLFHLFRKMVDWD